MFRILRFRALHHLVELLPALVALFIHYLAIQWGWTAISHWESLRLPFNVFVYTSQPTIYVVGQVTCGFLEDVILHDLSLACIQR